MVIGGAVLKMEQVIKRFFCHCITAEGKELYLSTRATCEKQASEKIHSGYEVEYVLEVLTPLEMEQRKRHLRSSLYASAVLS